MKENGIFNKLKQEKWISLMILGLMVLVSVFYAYKIGLLFCGYFFADDHEIARLYGGIQREGLFKTMAMWIEADTNLRFRPVYWIFRVLESYVCGLHITWWHLIKACEIGFCAWISFVFARKMKASYLVSLLFGVVGFFGTQCAIVYRLGPQEPMALIWLFLGLVCAVNYVEKTDLSKTKRRWWLMGFHVFMTLMMLTKESFLILVPICVFFFLYLELQKIYVGEISLKKAMLQVMKKHIPTIVYEAVVFLICMSVIVFHSGVSSTGYAGLDASYTVGDYFAGMWKIWKGELMPYMILMLAAMLINVMCSIRYKKQKGFVFYRFCETVIVFYFVFSQSLLHAKSGMSERYLFPCITGILIYVCCFSVPLWVKLNKEKCRAKICWKSLLIQGALAVWAVVMIAGSQFHALCLNYVFTCSQNTQMLIRLSELSDRYGGKDCKIIVSTQYGEWNLAISAFMEEIYGIDKTYSLSQSETDNTVAKDRYVIGEKEPGVMTIPEADIYVAQKEFLTIKMRECGVEYTEMEHEIFGSYMILLKEVAK